MSEAINTTIQELQGQLRNLEDEASQLKMTINLLCKRAGREPLYAEVAKSGTLSDIQADTFYGQPLNSCIRDYLDRRKIAGLGPASVREIFDGLTQGGFQFNAKSDDNAQRSLRITLTKSTHTFHKLPNGSFGLLAWYPTVKPAKPEEVNDDDAAESELSEKTEAPAAPEQAAPAEKGGENVEKSAAPSR